jgi:hypothetical protein
MRHFVDSLLIFHRMLDFCLAPMLQFASVPKQSPLTSSFPYAWLVLVGYLGVKYLYDASAQYIFDLAVRLKFQITAIWLVLFNTFPETA